MILRHHTNYESIISFLQENIDYLTYDEIISEVNRKFNYKFKCTETLSYHLKHNGIRKGYTKKYRTKNIKGLRKIFESDLFKLTKLKNEEGNK